MCCLLCRAGSVILSNSGCSAAGEQSPTHFQMCTDCPQSQIYSSSWRLYLMNDHSGKLRFLFVHFFFLNGILLIFITHSENHQIPPTLHWIISQIHPSSWSHSLLYLLRVTLLPTDVTVPYCLTSLNLGSILLPRKKKKIKCMKFLTHYIL